MEYSLDMVKPYEIFEFEAEGVQFKALQPNLNEFNGLYAFGWYQTANGRMCFASKFDGLEETFAWLVEMMNSTPIEPEKNATIPSEDEEMHMLDIIMSKCQKNVTRGTDVVHVIQTALYRMHNTGQFPDQAALEAWDEHFGDCLPASSS